MTLQKNIQNNWLQILILIYVAHAALMLALFLPLRLVTAIILIFITPGYFVARILRKNVFTYDGAFILLASSLALNILWILALNKVLSIKLNELNVFLMNMALVIILASIYLLTRDNEEKNYQDLYPTYIKKK